ncbi:MAG: M28 family peptidase [Pirellulaceae bacterium]
MGVSCGWLASSTSAQGQEDSVADESENEARFLSNIRQLTFEGRRAGEGYFNREGNLLVFQSEREEGNPFFQIYLMDLESGDVERVSPGSGKTTCAWIHPESRQVLFASTHEDPEAQAKQQAEIDLRASGMERRYSWDYDPTFELFAWDRDSGDYHRLTDAKGYDAEASWSPDGSRIVFTSNRSAYDHELTEAESKQLELDPSYFLDLYIMDADGSNVRRLTDTPGYDGGPFFSPNGEWICWRRFSEDGSIAEVWVMRTDGSEARQITRFGAMSWAPYFHPSGEYLIFTTNLHGFANFELYLADLHGDTPPVRVTWTDGFDGLPVFTPDGNRLAWTTNRAASKQSQIFVADWNHEFARQMLAAGRDGAEFSETTPLDNEARQSAVEAAQRSATSFSAADIMRHVDYLCRPEIGGRATGTPGERAATAYVAAYLENLGIVPAGDDNTWFQSFEFTSGVTLGDSSELSFGETSATLDVDWKPVAFSAVGPVEPAEVVFGGYGIVAPAGENQEEYDSFVHLDVRDKWVIVFRFMPEDITPERRQHLSTHSSLRYKAMTLRDMGARGMIVVSGPNSLVREQLVPLQRDGSGASTSLAVISVSDELAAKWLALADKDLRELQTALDTGEMVMGFPIPDLTLGGMIDIQQETGHGRNVLGRLQVGAEPSDEVIIVGAHVDHLGIGQNGNSLARDEERGGIHYGADDNASGVAGMLEVAEYLAGEVRDGKWRGKRDIIFAAWSGEEMGLLGSSHFVSQWPGLGQTGHGAHAHEADPHADDPHATDESDEDAAAHEHAHGHAPYPRIAACLNMDMIGRLRERLVLQGTGSSSAWAGEIERRNVPVGLTLTLQPDGNLPTDAAVFYRAGIPILSAFTGSHEEYHTPRDTPETLNPTGAAQVARLMGLIARSLSAREETLDYIAMSADDERETRAALRAYLGTVPDYAQEGVVGVLLSSVAKNGPAEQGGVRGGDVIVELAGRKIENIYDYTFAIEALKIGQPVKVVVQRGDERVELEVTPGSRD